MTGMKCISGVGHYVKYKVAETRNNSLVRVRLSNMFLILFMIIAKLKHCIHV